MFYIQLFSFSTSPATNLYGYMRLTVCLWPTYGSCMVHLGELVQPGVVNQLT